jgi:hypothetical protein
MSFGLNFLQSVTSTDAAARFINSDESNSIRLLFPNLDFGFSYAKEPETVSLDDYFDAGHSKLIWEDRPIAAGHLLPHIKLSNDTSLRQHLS